MSSGIQFGGDGLDGAVVVAVGGNLAGGYGSSKALLEAALACFAQAGLPVVRRSSWWRSAAWPDPAQNEYRNAVVLVEAEAPAAEVIQILQQVERRFGRTRTGANAPRTLDLDLVAYGRQTCRGPDLILPHPRAAERLFVMGPLAEIAPAWVHPVLGRTARDLAASATVGTDARPVD